MLILKRIGFSISGLAALILLVGFLLPDTAHVERAVTIAAPPETVFGYIDSLRRFNEWSPWYAMDPKARYAFSGPPSGVGVRMTWKSDDPAVGEGWQEVIALQPGRHMTTKIEFGSQGEAEANYRLEPEGAGTRVVWSLDSELGLNPVARYMGLMLDRWIGPQYEKGLARLKQLAEREVGQPSPG